jgi:hypothetical protein
VPLEVPLETTDPLEALPELALPLVDPEAALPPLAPEPIDPLPPDPVPLTVAPLEAPLDGFAPPEPDPPPAPLPGRLSEPAAPDEVPALWPEAPFVSEPVLLPQPMPSATQRENESRVRSVHIGRPRFEGVAVQLTASARRELEHDVAQRGTQPTEQPSLRDARPLLDCQPARDECGRHRPQRVSRRSHLR